VVPAHFVRQPTLPFGAIVLFVHGFNTTVKVAARSYEAHTEGLRYRTPHRTMRRVYWVFWPGDIGLLPRKPAAAAYPRMVKRARDSGEQLANLLAGPEFRGRRVRIVAHSLGNRVVLEALRSLNAKSDVDVVVDRVHLMAAAVPTYMCENGEFYEATARKPVEFVSWSPLDRVLRGAFPAGQFLETRRWSEAVGLKGGPTDRWSFQGNSHLDHGMYWSDSGTIATTGITCRFGRLRPVGFRRVGLRKVPMG
jgi:hypothetical protein